jgi:hypothetical protein
MTMTTELELKRVEGEKMSKEVKPTYWLSYGGGVNSTALAVLLCEGKLPQYDPFRLLWSDVQDEHEETYDFIFNHFQPYLRRNRVTLEIIRPREGVLERVERLNVVLQRVVRRCTSEAKIRPIERYLKAFARKGDVQLIGIDAAESHRAKPNLPTDDWEKRYPLVEADIDRDACVKIIEAAGLPVPIKSGCWHCPFMRVQQVLELARTEPCKFGRIVSLEEKSNAAKPIDDGRWRSTWGDRPATEWMDRANAGLNDGDLFEKEREPEMPCGCFDG